MKCFTGQFLIMLLACLMVAGCGSDTGDSSDSLIGKTFGGAKSDFGSGIQQTDDGGYIIVGETESFGPGVQNIYLIKCDAQLNLVWTRALNGVTGNAYSWGMCIRQTLDGGFIISGGTNIYGWLSYLLKTDAQGEPVWDMAFGSPASISYIVRETADGGYIAVSDSTFIKTDSSGATIWEVTWVMESGCSVVQTADNNFVIAGMTNRDFGEVYLEKRQNSNGAKIWGPRTIGVSISDFGGLELTDAGGFIVTGASTSALYLLNTDNNGTLVWKREFAVVDSCGTVQQTSDRGFILTGSKNGDVLLLKTDSEGNQLWSKTLGGSHQDCGNSVIQTFSGGYIVVGSTESGGEGESDVYVIATDAEGNYH